MEWFPRNTQTAFNRKPQTSWATCTREKFACVSGDTCARYGVPFTPVTETPWTITEVFLQCERKTISCSCQSADDHQAGFSMEAAHQVADEKKKKKSRTNFSISNVSITVPIFHVLRSVAVGIVNAEGIYVFGLPTCLCITRTLFTACGQSALFFIGPGFGP